MKEQTNKLAKRFPYRYTLVISITILEILSLLGIVVWLCFLSPYFSFLALIINAVCVVKIASSSYNPDYKVPWLIIVLCFPIVGFVLYFLFFTRRLNKRQKTIRKELEDNAYKYDDSEAFSGLKKKSVIAYCQAKMLCTLSKSHLFNCYNEKYFRNGEEMLESMKIDLINAKNFIYLEYFIIKDGEFWATIFQILKEKAKNNLEIKVVYDDIGCMKTLPTNFNQTLQAEGIEIVPFSKLKIGLNSEFNNRNHRKIMVIDGVIGYTGGINIGDEYIGKQIRFGDWKDCGVRLEGECVKEMTKLFLESFFANAKSLPKLNEYIYPTTTFEKKRGYVIPYGDQPKPTFLYNVSKIAIQTLINSAVKYVYITTPYLIIDNDLIQTIENTALRGVDVRIILPHIPDKKLVFKITKSFYPRLLKSGVKIYEFSKGFVHSKTYIADDKFAVVGTMNLDYRSLIHHYENGVWLYDSEIIKDIKSDIDSLLDECIFVTQLATPTLLDRTVVPLIKIFAPLL